MTERDEHPVAVERMLDVLVYAPIGLGLDMESVGPDLARRGRQHVAVARQIGEFTVRAGLRRIDAAIEQFVASGSENADTEGGGRVRAGDPVVAASPPDTGPELPIADYSSRTAAEIVKLLGALSADEIETIRLHEASTRDRRTILHKIARMQGA